MDILDMLIALEDHGVTQVMNCEGELVFFGVAQQPLPPDLAYQIKMNREDLLPRLKKLRREELNAWNEAAGKPPKGHS